MNVIAIFTVLEDGEIVATFDSYCLAVEHIDKHAVQGREYQVVKVFVTTEKKLPTIADTGWREEYFGMWAEHKVTHNFFIMLGEKMESVDCFNSSHYGSALYLDKENLIPRYDLAPVNLTPHPTYLESIEDYENAPANTVITCSWEETCPDLVKDSCGEWTGVGTNDTDESANLAGSRRKVLYWPEEAGQ